MLCNTCMCVCMCSCEIKIIYRSIDLSLNVNSFECVNEAFKVQSHASNGHTNAQHTEVQWSLKVWQANFACEQFGDHGDPERQYKHDVRDAHLMWIG